MKKLAAILFDLDGTLLDTAPDLAYALNRTLSDYHRPMLPLTTIRSAVSQGTQAILKLGFDLAEDTPEFTVLRQRFLDYYRQNIARETQVFPGVAEVLAYLKNQGIAWGIVSNKLTAFTHDLLQAMPFYYPPAVIVCGDTTAYCKPHPAPLLYACEILKVQPADCIYIGDAAIDIQAGSAAGITSLFAYYGYCSHEYAAENWPYIQKIMQPIEIIDFLKLYSKE
jgi:2-phosphoglycolate phosphatase